MRFSSRLYSLANDFRRVHLLSGDDGDLTHMTDDWRDEGPREMPAKGGNYICGHLRRQDFLWGRPEDVPSLKVAAKQLKKIAKSLGISNIFIASDGTYQGIQLIHSFYILNVPLFIIHEMLNRNGRTPQFPGATLFVVYLPTVFWSSKRNWRWRSCYS